MSTPYPSCHASHPNWPDGAKTKPSSTTDWRCTNCRKLLGVRRDDRMHIRFARSHEYLVGFPVSATCRSCGTLNRATSAAD